jgi:hypothetical protein
VRAEYVPGQSLRTLLRVLYLTFLGGAGALVSEIILCQLAPFYCPEIRWTSTNITSARDE